MSDDTGTTVEGFITDLGFTDQSKTINGFFADNVGQVASLTPKALSYFDKPASFADKRNPNSRDVNWVAESVSQIIVDQTSFATFVETVNALPSPPVGFFKLIDKLIFKYNPFTAHQTLETALLSDTDIAAIYVPGSFHVSSVIVADTVYLHDSSPSVTVPSYIDFEVTLPKGSTTTNFVIRLYVSVDAWLQGYNVSTIVKVIHPLPYDKLYTASLLTTTDNIFTTATTTTMLSYTDTLSLLGSSSVSGITEYRAVLTDGVNSTTVPFNLLYKGRLPTLYEVRNALKTALLTCGTGTEAGWKARIPGVFVSGRFYVLPLWDQTFTKPDQMLFPNIAKYSDYKTITNKILASLGYGDVSSSMDVFSLYYNKMTATVIPDMSGTVAISHLTTLIPDYQSYSPSDEQFGNMLDQTKIFTRELNTIMAVDSGAQTSTVYVPSTEGSLSFYSYTVGSYEICVITKLCYTTILGSIQ